MMYVPPCIHRSSMNIFPLLLLVLFSFITDVRINTHILYHNKFNLRGLGAENVRGGQSWVGGVIQDSDGGGLSQGHSEDEG